jgi:hypothetical protein
VALPCARAEPIENTFLMSVIGLVQLTTTEASCRGTTMRTCTMRTRTGTLIRVS